MKRKWCSRCRGTGKIPEPISTGIEMRGKREQAGLSRWKMSNRMNISQTYLYLLEHGKKPWSDKLIEVFNKALTM